MAMATATTLPAIELPKSVRGAPAELRRLIRKRQNSESAKRCRLRRKLEAAKQAGTQLTTAHRIQHLEKFVAQLSQKLTQTENAVSVLLSRRSIKPTLLSMTQQAPQTYSSTVHSIPQVPRRYPVPRSSISLPSQPGLSFSVSLPTSPTSPVTPKSMQNALRIPCVVPLSPGSQHTTSETDSTIHAARELEAENLPQVRAPVDVGSPFSDRGFMPSMVPASNIADDIMFFGEINVVSNNDSV